MSFERNLPATAMATMRYVASGATQLIVPANSQRAQLNLQGVDSFYFSPGGSVTGSTGLLAPSGAIISERYHVGPVFANSGAANGATMAVLIWESSD